MYKTCRPLFLDLSKSVFVSWLSSSRTEFVETSNSLASSRKYERVLGLKKKRTSSLILVFDDISPENRFFNAGSFMGSFTTHKTKFPNCQLFFLVNTAGCN